MYIMFTVYVALIIFAIIITVLKLDAFVNEN